MIRHMFYFREYVARNYESYEVVGAIKPESLNLD